MENDVYIKSDNLSIEQIVEAHLLPTEDVSMKVRELLSKKYQKGTVCVLPEGPQTIPFLSGVDRDGQCRKVRPTNC